MFDSSKNIRSDTFGNPIEPDFSKKVVLKLKLPKNNFIKKCAHKFLLFNKKKDQKDSNDF